ncbi:hypothetical protein O6H91_04G083400 [Diphasiastrum complanatum]|uniref:Uncharacterized protein n=2 Tax=Diphasiastrum complanatum TaxID=34168 RepID=A0ACC2A956_DIPCM|nr:hypothetical protein O6H91_Y345500 [Diphasiastrum complanatum]KAJ7514073.1 hypothetical protein O6H91_23G025700 [Diphasiastrum complanatum]KAJ7559393.1 hypothetical protein O6H91_04G083400 [Diphasiastrum complanatum]
MHFRSFEEFWIFYMNQHTKVSTRRWHFCGTGIGTILFLAAIIVKWWLVFLAPLFSYGLAWYSHFFVEGNQPVTFRYPVWSFLCDYRMFGLMLTGRMDREIKRLGKRPILQEEGIENGKAHPQLSLPIENGNIILMEEQLKQAVNSPVRRKGNV